MKFKGNTEKEQFVDCVLNSMTDSYTILHNGEKVTGQVVSSVISALRHDGWKPLPRSADFETALEELGFKVRAGKNRRGNRGRVVHL